MTFLRPAELFCIAAICLLASAGCGSDSTAVPDAGDAGDEVDSGPDSIDRDIRVDEPDAADEAVDEPDAQDAPEDAVEEVDQDDPDLFIDDMEREGVFPDDPTGRCIEGGDGALGWVQFSDGTPLAGATVALLFGDEGKHLGLTDETGRFFIQAPCEEVSVEVSVFESENFPIHPTVFNLPVGRFDAGVDEATLVVPLVTVEGTIVDVVNQPIPGAVLTAQLDYRRVEVFNTDTADEEGIFAVNVVPFTAGPYDLTAEGPQDSEKRYRTATLRVLIGDPPPDPSTFVLFEDRCNIFGTFRTSEEAVLTWFFVRASGEPYAGRPAWLSFEREVYFPSGQPNVLLDNVPLFCGVQTATFWNAWQSGVDWPCDDHDKPFQLCVNNYPLWIDTELTEPQEDGVEIDVVRLGGTVTDELGIPQRDVIVRIEGLYQWSEDGDRWFSYNETVSGEDGRWSMVVLPQAGLNYTVKARIRDDDRRPLGEFVGSVEVTAPTELDFSMPDAPPRCIMEGTVHSSEGTDFEQILLEFDGADTESGTPLYNDPPWDFFSEETAIWYRFGFPDEDIPFVPFFCGTHYLYLHSSNWPGCNSSPDQLCFNFWPWWSDEVIDAPLLDGIEIPVVHVSGTVTTEEGTPVEGASVNALAGNPFGAPQVTNGTGTGPDGVYDFVALPGQDYTLSVSVGDDHPVNPCADDTEGTMICQLDPADGGAEVGEEPVEVNFVMPRGPLHCRFSGRVVTSEGIPLLPMDFSHYDSGGYYGLFGWHFRTLEPGKFFRCSPFGCPSNPSPILDYIPLRCGEQPDPDHPSPFVQDLVVQSVRSSVLSSCNDTDNFDQPCLNSVTWFSSDPWLQPFSGDMVVPVVTVSGEVSIQDGPPIERAEIQASSNLCFDNGYGGQACGSVSNYALSRPDGSYEMRVPPSGEDDYRVVITTPIGLDLGQITFDGPINDDEVIDARFSLVE